MIGALVPVLNCVVPPSLDEQVTVAVVSAGMTRSTIALGGPRVTLVIVGASGTVAATNVDGTDAGTEFPAALVVTMPHP